MRNVADLERNRRIWILSLFLMFGVTAWAQPGHVKGEVTDSNGKGVAGVTIRLLGSNGEEQLVKTADDGSYAITDVAVGDYTLSTDSLEGYSFADPSTGKYDIAVRRGETVIRDFNWRNSGVVIDFGDPPTNGGGGIRPKMYMDPRGEQWVPISIRLNGIEKRQFDNPKTIEIIGEFSLSDDAEASIEIAQATLAEPYSIGRVRYKNLGRNRFSVTLKSSGWPGFAYNGELALLHLKVKPSQAEFGELEIRTERLRLVSRAGSEELPNRAGSFPARNPQQ